MSISQSLHSNHGKNDETKQCFPFNTNNDSLEKHIPNEFSMRLFANHFVALTLLAVCLLANAWQPAAAQTIKNGNLTVRLNDFHSFQTSGDEFAPTDMLQMPDGRFMVATLGGTVRLLDPSGSFISTLMSPLETGTTKVDVTHYGMTALALHPQFDQVGTFGYGKAYAMVTQEPEGITGVPADFTVPGSNPSMPFTNQDVVREYDLTPMLTSDTTSFVGQTVTSRDIWRIDSPQASHNAFDIAFRSNGDLYISSGDGGFTELNSIGPLHNRRQKSQDLDSAYGKILRINPDPTAFTLTGGQSNQYSIPEDNPFVNTPGALDEVYANGVRSPYRLNLDPNDPTGETLWLGDVGEGSREEVSKVQKGDNLGWGRFEGTNVSSSGTTLQGNPHTPPEFQYSHSPRSLTSSGGLFNNYNEEAGGNSISGGHIYRGQGLGAEFQGLYIGANLGHHAGNPTWLPRLFYGDPDEAAVDLFKFEFDPFGQEFDDAFLNTDQFVPGFDFAAAGITPGKFDLPQLILSIAEDNAGELYVLGVDFNGLGTISKIIPGGIPGDVDGINGVTIDDFHIIRDALGQAVATRDMGDITGDGFVRLDDFQQWLENVPPAVAALASFNTQVPEPSVLALVGIGLLFASTCNRTHDQFPHFLPPNS